MIRKIPYLLSILGIIGGVFIAILFGINEEIFKEKIVAGLEKNVKIQQIEDPTKKSEKIISETDKNWRYYQRFHFHANGIGAMMLALLLLLGRVRAPVRLKTLSAYAISVGGFLYPFVWLFAALYGPEMGRAEAKEAFAIFGYMGGLFLLGALATLVLTLRYEVSEPNE